MHSKLTLKVVIVDDAPFIREVLNEILVRAGHQVVGFAENGEQAVSECLKHKPDLVVMDIVMPIKSGLQATVEILKELPKTKVIACTTVDQEIMMMRAIEAGAHDYITKPFKGDQVIKIIEKVFGSFQQQEETHQ